jgi:hypothetical protein
MPRGDRAGPDDSGQPGSARAGWRGGNKKDSPSSHRWQHDWARQGDRQQRSNVLRHRIKIGVWLALGLGLVAAIVIVALFFPKKTPLIALAVTDYEAPLPPNAWAREDLEQLATLHARNLDLADISDEWTSSERGLRALATKLSGVKPGGPKRDVVVMYVSMHGIVNEAAEPCLLPPGAAPLATDSWLRVSDLLDTIKKQKLPNHVKKVLILDACRMDANWSIGLLYNGFADRLQAVVDDANIPNLVVLNSTSPGQIGACAPLWKASVFGEFVCRGLHGDADTESPGDDNGRVSLRELHAYLRHRIGQWVVANRLDEQQPMLIAAHGQADDFDLAWCPSSTMPAKTSGELPSDLAGELWKRHASLTAKSPVRFSPAAWEDFQHKLLWLEQLTNAGKAYQGLATETRADLDRAAASLERKPPPEAAVNYSFPMAAHFSSPATASDADLKLWRTQLADPAVKLPPELVLPYLVRAQEAWKWAAESPTRDRIRRALQLAGEPERDARAGLVELHFLRMLDRWLDAELWTNSPPALEQCIALYERAEQAAVPKDERAQYAVRAKVNQADVGRLDAVDRLFVGDRQSLVVAGTRATEATQGYDAAIAQSKALADAWRVHDNAYAELPYLAQWVLRRPAGGRASDVEQSSIDRLETLSIQLQALRMALDAPIDERNGGSELAAIQKKVVDSLASLRKLYDDECYRLRFETGIDQKVHRDLTDVLSIPLVTGEVRNELQAALARTEKALDQRYRQIEGSNEASEAKAVGTRWLQTLATLKEHPAAGSLEHADATESQRTREEASPPSDDVERLRAMCLAGGRVRARLASIADRVRKQLADGAQSNDDAKASLWSTRSEYRRADALVRSAAPILADLRWVDGAQDPTYQLRLFDLHELLLWQAERTEDDYWGPAQPDQTSYFAVVAQDELNTAERLFRAGARRRESLSQRLQKLRTAESDGLRPVCSPESLLVIDDDQSLSQTAALNPAAGTPPGTVSYFVRDLQGETVPVSTGVGEQASPRRRLPMTIEAKQGMLRPADAYSFMGQQLSNRVPAVDGVALFRGHESKTPISIQRSGGGLTITHLAPEALDPRITVHGQLKQRSAITFIFDCSGSMSDIVQQDNQKRTRLEVARAALQAILDELAASRSYRVAVRVYGHRARWKDRTSPDWLYTKVGTQQQQAAQAAGLAFSVHPSNDVEVILPMGQFGAREDATVKGVLDELEPAGETPLYLAIIQALEQDFRNEGDAQCRIVAITDGVNTQSSGGPAGVIKVRQQVEQALDEHRQQKVRVDMVGFDLAAADQQGKLDDLKAISRRSGGTFYSASDPSGLLKALQDSLGLSKFVVENAQGELIGPPRELESTVELNPPRGRAQEYTVRLVNAQPPVQSPSLKIEQSESLELFLSTDRRRFEFQRYTGSREQELRDSLTNLQDPSDLQRMFFVGAHLPEWQGNAVRFPISIQNADATRFSPRPAEGWVEIRPVIVGSREEQPPFVFYDLDYEPRRPVPVVSCLGANWPPKAEKAEIRMWFKMTKTAPGEVIGVLDAERQGGERGIAIKAMEGVTLRVHRDEAKTADSDDRLTVTEQHTGAASDLFSLKVELDPPPRRSIHTYYPEGSMIRHTFSYAQGDAEDWRNVRILITTRAKLIDRAVALPKPLVVTVPDRLLRN